MRKRFIPVLALVLVLLVGLFFSLTLSQRAQATPLAGGCWYQKAEMPSALRARAAVELNGLIYVMGGIAGPSTSDERVANVDVYNPVEDRWNHPADGGDPDDLGWPRAWISAEVVDGVIYAIGGNGPHLTIPDTMDKFNFVEKYDPGVGFWAFTSGAFWMPTPRDDAAIGVVSDMIYVIGGYSASYVDVVEAFDPLTTTASAAWETKTPMTYSLAMLSGAVVDDMIYVMGGKDGEGGGGTTHMQVYDPISDTWSLRSDLLVPRSGAAAGTVGNLIYLIGGSNTSTDPPAEERGRLDSVHRYNPTSDTWNILNWMPTRRDHIASAVAKDATGRDLIFVFGGQRSWDGEVVSTVEAFDPLCGNAPPDEPASPSPGNWTTDVPLDANLEWSAAGASTYDVYFGEDIDPGAGIGASTPLRVSEGESASSYDPGPLKPNTSYVWRVVAIDDQGAATSLRGRWTFKTGPLATVSKTANPTALPEPGGSVEFTVEVTNDRDDEITLQGLVDDVHGNLAGQGTCDLDPAPTIPAAGTYTCSFSAEVTGNANYTETDIVTATIDYGSTTPFDVSASAVVTITDAQPEIAVAKTADPTSVLEPGGPVQFTVVVTNTGREDLTLEALVDDVHGDLNGEGTCSTSGTIAAGAAYTCSFTKTVSGAPGYIETDTVTATVRDDEKNVVQASDEAQVEIREPQAGIEVRKQAAVDKAFVGDTITYTYTVENVGDIQLSSVSASDDRLGAISLDKGALALGEIATGTASYVVAASDWPAGITNTVTVTGTTPAEAVVTDADTVVVPVGGMTFVPLIRRD